MSERESFASRALDLVTWTGGAAFLVVCLLHALVGDGLLAFTWLHSTMAWLPLGVLPFLAVAAVRRQGVQAVPALLTLALWLFFNRPPLPPAPLPEGTHFRLVSSNTLMVNPTPDALVQEVLSHDPDIVAFQELTPDIQAAMAAVTSLPFRREHPARHSFGIGLYSRFPIVSEQVVTLAGVDWQRVVLSVEGTEVEVWNVHTLPPRNGTYHRNWLAQVSTLSARVSKVERPLLVVGDFNLTRHHQGYADLTTSLRDAHRDCGRWMAATWPANGYFFGGAPKIRLDYIFLGTDLRCQRVSEGVGEGSDHRPLVADLVLSR